VREKSPCTLAGIEGTHLADEGEGGCSKDRSVPNGEKITASPAKRQRNARKKLKKRPQDDVFQGGHHRDVRKKNEDHILRKGTASEGHPIQGKCGKKERDTYNKGLGEGKI